MRPELLLLNSLQDPQDQATHAQLGLHMQQQHRLARSSASRHEPNRTAPASRLASPAEAEPLHMYGYHQAPELHAEQNQTNMQIHKSRLVLTDGTFSSCAPRHDSASTRRAASSATVVHLDDDIDNESQWDREVYARRRLGFRFFQISFKYFIICTEYE